MISPCSFVLSSRPTTIPARSGGRGARAITLLLLPAVGSRKPSLSVIALSLSLPMADTSDLVGAMDGAAAPTPAVTERRVLRSHRYHHIRPRMHVPRAYVAHRTGEARQQPDGVLAHVIKAQPRAFDHHARNHIGLGRIAIGHCQALPRAVSLILSKAL